MSEAVELFISIWVRFVRWFFNDTKIEGTYVTLGYVSISVWLFGIIISNILNIPRASGRVTIETEKIKKEI